MLDKKLHPWHNEMTMSLPYFEFQNDSGESADKWMAISEFKQVNK